MVKIADPWMEIKNMRQEMDKIMNDTLRSDKLKTVTEKDSFSLWQPVADYYESSSHLIIEVELPGVSQENINLEIHGSRIMIYGQKVLEQEASGSAYHLLERSHGPFSRTFAVPDEIDTSAASAVFKNGMLRVSIPKEHRKRKNLYIEVSSS